MDTTKYKITIESTTDGICTMLNALAYAAAVADESYQNALAKNNSKAIQLYGQLSMQFSAIYEDSLQSVREQIPEVHKLFVRDFYNGGVIEDAEEFLNTFKF